MVGRKHRTRSLLSLLLTLIVTGCSGGGDQPEVGRVSGRITIAGEPLSGVIVTFMPDVGRSATGVTDDDGHYKLIYLEGVEGCKLGPNTVAFMAPTGGIVSHSIPAKYQVNSPLKADVKKGNNTFDFDLEKDNPKGKPVRAPSPTPD